MSLKNGQDQTEGILIRMTGVEISFLSVHDSYKVPKQFEERLRNVMAETYKEAIGLEPAIGQRATISII